MRSTTTPCPRPAGNHLTTGTGPEAACDWCGLPVAEWFASPAVAADPPGERIAQMVEDWIVAGMERSAFAAKWGDPGDRRIVDMIRALPAAAPAGGPIQLLDTPQVAVDAAENVLLDFGYEVTGDCAVHVAHAVLRSVTPAPDSGEATSGSRGHDAE